MLAQLLAARVTLEDAIAATTTGSASGDAVRAQLEALGDLQRQIAGAGPVALASLRGEIAATMTASRALAQESRTTSQANSAEATLAAVSARTRATVQRVAADLFERRVLDPYLQFESDEEREAYRRREAERRTYIDRELARGTPQGNLNASHAALAQIEDAGAHGADRSPDYERLRNETLGAINQQRDAMRAGEAVPAQAPSVEAAQPAASNADLDTIAAIFRTAGVQAPASDPASSGHGLAETAQARHSVSRGRLA